MNNPPTIFSETRSSDRKKMAAILAGKAIEAGATAIVTPCSYNKHRLDVQITAPGGACITADFDGKTCQPGIFVVTWNVSRLGRINRVFFNPSALGGVNDYHYGKAQRVCYGFDELVDTLCRDVKRFVDGSGYLGHDDPRIVEMKEWYRINGWPW